MKIIKKIILLGIVYIIIFATYSKVNAASTSLKTNTTKMKVGETATITVTVDAAAWNLKVTGAASLNEADSSSDGENTKKTFKTTFKATKSGKYEVKLSGDVTDGTTMKTQNVSDKVTIEVEDNSSESTKKETNNSSNTEKETKKSSDATLRNLGITPKQYDFSGFQKSKTTYNVSVDNSAESIKIYAYSTDSKATVSGDGTKKLKVGENSFKIKVTAEDKKTTKTYTLNITRKEKKEDENKIDEKNTEENTIEKEEKNEEEKTDNTDNTEQTEAIEDSLLKNIKIEEYVLEPQFNPGVHEYSINIKENIDRVNITTEKDNNAVIEIAGNNNLKVGTNIITIIAYDKKSETTETYQIFATVGEEEINIENFNYEVENAYAGVQKKSFITYGTIGVIIFLMIIFFIGKRIIRNRNDEVEDEENVESSEIEIPASLYKDKEEKIKKQSKPKGKRFK